MAITFVTTNNIGVGTRFSFAAAGDALVVLQGVTLGSTTGMAFTTAFGDIDVTVLGNMFSATQMQLTVGSSFTLGATGSFQSFQPTANLAGLFLTGAGSTVQIDGSFSAPEGIGLLTSNGGHVITVTGSISAASAVYLGTGGIGDEVLVNSGQITANTTGELTQGVNFNNAIFVDGGDTRVSNLHGGVIAATSSAGNGVRLSDTATGTVVTNHGTITSLNAIEVYFDAAGAATGATPFAATTARCSGTTATAPMC